MSRESFKPRNFRHEDITIGQAHHVVWEAGSIALGQTTDLHHRQIIADELGRMFGKIDDTREIFERVKEDYPEAGTPKITMDSIMMSMDYQRNLIYQREQQLHDGPVNPFMIHDDRLPAYEGLVLYIEAAYNEVINKQ
jgi:hypothetical protein